MLDDAIFVSAAWLYFTLFYLEKRKHVLNDDENYLNGTRVDYNIQYSDLDQFDAYQKACMEMTYR